jgi:phospholipase/carboxylesterase
MSTLQRIMDRAIVVQDPKHPGPEQLFMLFHGVGSQPRSMLEVAQCLAEHFPLAHVVCIPSAHDSDVPGGLEWFSVQGVSEENRHERVRSQMPLFLQVIQTWQQNTGVSPEATALVGFSQGGIMSLESTQSEQLVAGRIIALSARFVSNTPKPPHKATTLHLIHGKRDPVIAYAHCVQAAEHLVHQGADLTADVLPDLGHEINASVLDLMIQRLQGHIPQELWRLAQQEAQSQTKL